MHTIILRPALLSCLLQSIDCVVRPKMGQLTGLIFLLLNFLASFSREVTSLPASDVSIPVTRSNSDDETRAFTCSESGFFPSTDSCQDYYRCEDLKGEGLEWSVLLLRCPPGTVFNVDTKNCQLSSGHPECEAWSPFIEGVLSAEISEGSSTQRFARETATSSLYCNVEATTSMMRDTDGACSALRSIGSYVEDISRKQPLQLSSVVRESRYSFLEDYNEDLITAQESCNEWKHVTMMRTINNTYTLAKEFDTKFHDLLLESVSFKLDGSSSNITKKMIVDITDKLATQRKMLLDSDNPTVTALLKKGIEENEQKLQQLQRDYGRLEKENGYAELRKFFEFAQNKSKIIEENIKDSIQKMEAFHIQVTKDLSSFERHKKVAEQQIVNLKSQKEANKVEINNLRIEKAKQNVIIKELRNQLFSVSNTRGNLGRRKRAAPLLIFLAGAALGGGAIYWFTNEEKKRNKKVIEAHEATIRNLQSQIESITRQITHYDQRMTDFEQRSRTIDTELTSLGNLEAAFQNLKNEVTTVLPSFSKAKTGLESIMRIVHEVRQNLEYLAVQTTDATTVLDMRNMLYFIYNNITDLKCNWDRAIHGISVLGECV